VHPSCFLSDKDLSDEEAFDKTVEWLQEKAECDCCQNKTGAKTVLSCKCFHPLRPDAESGDLKREAVARFILFFAGLNKQHKQQKIIEWIRYAELFSSHAPTGQKHLKFLLPMIQDDENPHEETVDVFSLAVRSSSSSFYLSLAVKLVR